MVGAHLHRNITWAEDARPFMTYLARTCYMLQQGQFVADVAYLLNEGAPSTMPIWGAGTTPAPPAGYDYDFVNADVLLHRLDVDQNSRVFVQGGRWYRVIVLPESRRMRPELLRKLRELVVGGATIVGPRPLTSPSLAGGVESDHEVEELAAELWGDLDGVSRSIRYVGRGRVVWGRPVAEVLAMLQSPPDAEFANGLGADIAWLHRRTEEADIYYVANCTDQPRRVDARFRVAGAEAELWRADTGAIEPAGYEISGDRTIVPLELVAREAVFVVFRREASEPARKAPEVVRTPVAAINGPWRVAFPPNFGAPAEIELDKVEPWSASGNAGVSYFSGTATYTTEFTLPGDGQVSGGRIVLDLGDVRDLAAVRLNGEVCGTLWKPPFRVDVTNQVREGANRLEVAVTNQWSNRILGDSRAPEADRVLTSGGGRRGALGGGFGLGPREPAESGLIGPVQLFRETSAARTSAP
jgi:hypothetical protein